MKEVIQTKSLLLPTEGSDAASSPCIHTACISPVSPVPRTGEQMWETKLLAGQTLKQRQSGSFRNACEQPCKRVCNAALQSNQAQDLRDNISHVCENH